MAIYSSPKIKFTGQVRPDDKAAPTYKEGMEYAVAWGKFMYDAFLGDADHQAFLSKAAMLQSYSDGNQDPSKTMDLLLDDNQEGARTSTVVDDGGQQRRIGRDSVRDGYLAVNHTDIFSPMPKYIQVITGIMDQTDHHVTPESTDPQSSNAKIDMKYMAMVKADNHKFFTRFKEMMGIITMDREVQLPQSVQELEMWQSIGAFKLPYEIGLERATGFSLDEGNWKYIKDKTIANLVTFNRAGCITLTDPVTFDILPEWVDVTDIYKDGSPHNSYTDSSFGFAVKYYTIGQIKEMLVGNQEWSDEDIEKLSKSFADDKILGNGSFDRVKYNGFRIPVMHGYYRTKDSHYTTIRRTKAGTLKEFPEPWQNNTTPPRMYDNDKRKTEVTEFETIYEVVYPLGFDKAISFGRFKDIPYDFKSRNVPLPISITVIDGKSITESAIKPLDMLNMTMLRLEGAIAKSPPPGIAIDIDKLSGVRLGSNNMDPIDIIRLYRQSGDYIYRLKTPGNSGSFIGGGATGKPIEELRGGLGTVIADAIQSTEFHLRNLSEVTGLDRITSVSKTPGTDQGAAVTKLAVDATQNNLQPIYKAYLRMKEQVVRYITLKSVAIALSDGPASERMKNIMGQAPYDAIRAAGMKHPIHWGFTTKAHPTAEMKAEIRNAALDSIQAGRNGVPAITQSEFMFIMQHMDSVDGINTARVYLAYKERQRQDLEDARREQGIKMQSEEQQKLQAMKDQAEQKKRDDEFTLEMAKIQAKAEAEISVLRFQASIGTAPGEAPSPPSVTPQQGKDIMAGNDPKPAPSNNTPPAPSNTPPPAGPPPGM